MSVVDLYEKAARRRYDKKKTINRRIKGVKYWSEWCEDNGVDIKDPSEDDYYIYVTEIIDEGLTDTTVGSYASSVSMLYQWMEKTPRVDEYDGPNPTANVDIAQFGVNRNTSEYVQILRSDSESEKMALSKERVEKLWQHAGSPSVRNELIIRLLWDTGLRCGELSEVRLANVDVDNKELRIQSAKLNPSQELYNRTVYWTDKTNFVLKQWLRYARDDLYRGDSEYLLVTQQSPQMRPSHISRIVKQAAFRADEEGDYDDQIQEWLYDDANGNSRWLVTGHRLRHSAISYWVNDLEMRLHEARMLAGHEQISSTMRYVTTSWEQVQSSYRSAVE